MCISREVCRRRRDLLMPARGRLETVRNYFSATSAVMLDQNKVSIPNYTGTLT